MTHQTVTKWVCDRCHREAQMEERGQPTGWCRIFEVLPASAALDEAKQLAEICNICRRELKQFLSEIPRELDVAS